MKKLGQHTLTFLLFFSLTLSALADNWFSNDDTIVDLARMAPSKSALFVGVDLSETLSEQEISYFVEEILKAGLGPNAAEMMKQSSGISLEQLVGAFGTRLSVSVVPPNSGPPVILVGLEVREPQMAVQMLKDLGAIPRRSVDRELQVGDSTFHFIGKGGYGLYGDYLLFTNSPEALQTTLGEGDSLHGQPVFLEHVAKVSVDQGLLVYGEIPQELTRQAPQLETLNYILAGVGVSHHNFLTKIHFLLDQEVALTKALLSEGGELKGEAARFIPKEWGFIASFQLKYLQRFLERLNIEEPEMAQQLNRELSQVEGAIGVTLDQLLQVADGEVSVSSNGVILLPAAYLGYARYKPDYRLTVTMPVKDTYAAHSLLRGAWERLSLDSERLMDDIVVVPRAELCYVVEPNSKQLIMSYGPQALATLRECLALREGESLASVPTVARHYPVSHAVSTAYLDLAPVVNEIKHNEKLRPMMRLLRDSWPLDGVAQLTIQEGGLVFSGTGSAPMLLGGPLAGYLFLGQSGSSSSNSREAVR